VQTRQALRRLQGSGEPGGLQPSTWLIFGDPPVMSGATPLRDNFRRTNKAS